MKRAKQWMVMIGAMLLILTPGHLLTSIYPELYANIWRRIAVSLVWFICTWPVFQRAYRYFRGSA